MRVSRQVRVTGRVQGVFFRAWTRDQARKLDVGGWVRNLGDGSVEALVVGEQSRVDELIRLLGQGPHRARVDEVTVTEAAAGDSGTFEIRS
jgi:acylphosphatase